MAAMEQGQGPTGQPVAGDGFEEVELKAPEEGDGGAVGGAMGGVAAAGKGGDNRKNKKGGVSDKGLYARKLVMPDHSFLEFLERLQDDERAPEE